MISVRPMFLRYLTEIIIRIRRLTSLLAGPEREIGDTFQRNKDLRYISADRFRANRIFQTHFFLNIAKNNNLAKSNDSFARQMNRRTFPRHGTSDIVVIVLSVARCTRVGVYLSKDDSRSEIALD